MDASLPELIRFGYGPRGRDAATGSGIDPDRLLLQLTAPDPGLAPFTRPDLADRLDMLAAARAERDSRRAGNPPDNRPTLALRAVQSGDARSWVLQAVAAENGFAERMVNFWANRLTVGTGRGELAYLVQSFRDDALRPHLAGRFPDMLLASVLHPAMLLYLDQVKSIGPNSPDGRHRKKGLNENYAREFLELHSMGSGYTQEDVTELARLLAGLTYDLTGVVLDPRRVEPGSKTILGAGYGAGMDQIAQLVARVALRPETAQSVSLALARHFIADVPPAALVAEMAQVYLAGDGALLPVYARMLQAPEARAPGLLKVRSPHEFVVAGLRALNLTGTETTPTGPLKRGFRAEDALKAMGQPVFAPRGPDGWPETGAAWISAPWLAARLDWAARLARQAPERIDPVALAARVLGDLAPGTLQAVAGAEQRWEGVAVLLGSPAFMRR